MFEESILEIFLKASEKKDISVIEGVMGFYDGIDGVNEKGSTAHLSKLLKSPVILVLDSRGSARRDVYKRQALDRTLIAAPPLTKL